MRNASHDRRFSVMNDVRVIITFAAMAMLALSPVDSIQNFDGATGWINTPALTPQNLRGKVVLVDFWEYTCINCLRTLPYLREWYRRYANDGLVIVGVHTPEFKFSSLAKNVADAAKRLGVTWPVVLDSDHAVWERYHNSIWPHEYLYDQNGRLIESVEGEGNYPQTESAIQTLLKQRNPALRLPRVMALLPQDSYDKPGAVCYPHTPEILVSVGRGGTVANASTFIDPSNDNNFTDSGEHHQDGAMYLQGFWHQAPQAVIFAGGDGYAAFDYRAIEVVGVLKPENGAAVRANVLQDGKPLARQDAGTDVRYDSRGNSYVTVDAPRAYELVMNKRYGAHELRLQPDGLGLGIYSFDFESCEAGADK